MIKLEALYAFMEGNFDYLLVVDDAERIIHMSDIFQRQFYPADGESPQAGPGRAPRRPSPALSDVLSSSSYSTFKSAMGLARAGSHGVAIYAPIADPAISIPLKAGHATAGKGDVFLFFGDKVEGLSARSEFDKDERVKELACLYRVIDWTEVSANVNEFFTHLPKYLSAGMVYPEEAVVYSTYQGVEYGQKPSSANFISVALEVGGRARGQIQVGYLDNKHVILPEEQKMLDEIGRTLTVALERKEFRERLTLMQQEEAEYNRRVETLSAEIAARTRELEDQKTKLGVANSYLDKVNRGWEETKVRLETMFNAIPDEVVLIDRNRRVVMTNREGIVAGNYCYQSFFGRERPCEDCRLARILKDKTPLMISMKHGDRYFQVHALPVYREDEVDGILEFYRDVTLEKTYDQQLQQADKLASLGQLVSGIGHEINNPNQFIRGNIKIVKQALGDMLPIIDDYYQAHRDLKIARLNYDFLREHIMTLVDDMAHGSERIKAIVESLRSFARKDEGLLVDKVDMNTLIEASTRLVHQEVHKRADVELQLADGLPTFTGNSQKIEQVLINLIVNASQAMPDDRKGLIIVKTSVADGHVVVDVKDNGQGMAEKTMKQIFDPFFTTKRARGGTGLGLAISYKIVQEHGGRISVTSKPGEGSTFTIRIPCSLAPQGAQPQPGASAQQAANPAAPAPAQSSDGSTRVQP
jgi:signal transduction histidine kinase